MFNIEQAYIYQALHMHIQAFSYCWQHFKTSYSPATV